VNYRNVVDHSCFSSGWENPSGEESEQERGEKQEKSGKGKRGLLVAVDSTQLR